MVKSHLNVGHQVPTHLLKPMWLRSRESLVDGGLVYDPVASRACSKCTISSECLIGDISQAQLLHSTIAQLCDVRVKQFIDSHSDAWVINVGAGLDTRFYRLDNGRCHWVELDVTENLLWREQLFHRCERYQHRCGSVHDLSWLSELSIPETAPVMIVSEMALLEQSNDQVAQFMQALGRNFIHAQACLVLAGDKTNSVFAKRLGCDEYQHGFESPAESLLNWLPWAEYIRQFSPLEQPCIRWKWWQKWAAKSSGMKYRLTPIVVHVKW